MKFIVSIVIFLAIIGGIYFFLAKNYKPATQTADQTQNVSCIQGVNGNSGDNYCSNTYKPSSKCLPRTENTYPDGCTK